MIAEDFQAAYGVPAAGANASYDGIAGMAEHAKSNDVVLGHFGAAGIRRPPKEPLLI